MKKKSPRQNEKKVTAIKRGAGTHQNTVGGCILTQVMKRRQDSREEAGREGVRRNRVKKGSAQRLDRLSVKKRKDEKNDRTIGKHLVKPVPREARREEEEGNENKWKE